MGEACQCGHDLSLCVLLPEDGIQEAIFTCDEVRGRRSTDDIRPWKILEIVPVEA